MRLTEFKKLAELHPDNPRIVRDYANALISEGMILQSRRTMQNLYHHLIKINRQDEAEQLIRQHGEWIRGEEDSLRYKGEGPFLALNDKYARSGLFKRNRRRDIKESEVLFRTGDPADMLYLILDGELAISRSNELAGPCLLNFIGRGDIVGEGALIAGARRTADVFANKDSVLLEFTTKEAREALQRHPDMQTLIEEEEKVRTKIITLASSPLFSRVPLSERLIIAEQSMEMSLESQAMLKDEKGFSRYVAVIISGKVECYFTSDNKQHYSGSLYAGNLFGTDKLFLEYPMPLKLVAKDRVKLLSIPIKVIKDLMSVSPDFEKAARDMTQLQYTQAAETIRVILRQP